MELDPPPGMITLSRTARLLTACGILLGLCGCSPGEEEVDPLPPVGVEEGLRAPPLVGRLSTGEEFRLENRATGATLLVFYRGGGCGLCRERLRGLAQHMGAYEELGARVVAVTPDPPERTAETLSALGIQLPVVSVDSATLQRWGVLDAPDQPPLPATFLLGEHGVIRFRHRGRNAGDRVGDASLLALLKQLEGSDR